LLDPDQLDNPNPGGGAQAGLVSINEDYERDTHAGITAISTGKLPAVGLRNVFFEQNRSWNAFDFANANPAAPAQGIPRTPYAFNTNPVDVWCCGAGSFRLHPVFPGGHGAVQNRLMLILPTRSRDNRRDWRCPLHA